MNEKKEKELRIQLNTNLEEEYKEFVSTGV